MARETPTTPSRGWRLPSTGVSLPEVHGSIAIPRGAGFWRKLFAFAGPGYLVAVGYMDPGNWATDLAGGARYGYTLLSVIMMSNLMAILLQALAARLGIASGRDLAQACRDSYSRPAVIGLWIICEIAILGETVMPHSLYLRSSIVQTRMYTDSPESRREAIHFASIDSAVALMFALFINAAILVMAAATFHGTGHQEVADIGDAYQLLSPLLGSTMASALFAIALLCSGQHATLTGTLAGQIVMEGFINLRIRPWLRRLITRGVAIVPAIIVVGLYGERGTSPLIILSQVVLSLQLPFAVFPLVMFTSDPAKMGQFANPPWVKVLAWGVAVMIAVLNVWLLYLTFA